MANVAPDVRQLITVRTGHWRDRTGRLDFWHRRSNGRWALSLTARARFGAHGLVPGPQRRQFTDTTPGGYYRLPFVFGRVTGTDVAYPYRRITWRSWWCEDNRSSRYNRWVEQYPLRGCRTSQAEHLADFPTYERAVVISFNWQQVHRRGAGIFLHVNGGAYTAGCVSTDRRTMTEITQRLRGWRHPRIAIGLYGANIQSLG